MLVLLVLSVTTMTKIMIVLLVDPPEAVGGWMYKQSHHAESNAM